jgi:hypothetical protein
MLTFSNHRYQEGYVAKRRLNFTNQQFVYVCSEEISRESYAFAIQRSRYIEEMKLRNLFSLTETGGLYGSSEGCIGEYTKRDLTYYSDAFKTFLGILNLWSTLPSPLQDPNLHSIWGLSILKNSITLTWYHPRPGRHRPDFPSCAWIGWRGSIKFGTANSFYNSPVDVTIIQVGYDDQKSHSSSSCVPQVSDTWVSLDMYVSSVSVVHFDPGTAARLLRIMGLCPNLFRFHEADTQTTPGIYPWLVTIPTGTERDFKCIVHMDYNLESGTDTRGYIAFMLTSDQAIPEEQTIPQASSRPSPATYHCGGSSSFLILRPGQVEGTHERVNMSTISLGIFWESTAGHHTDHWEERFVRGVP